ncbi:hypothetical protein D3C73_1179760 [compost metagenome]
MFSARAATATTSTGAPALARARTAPTTLAAPDMSIFILPMPEPDFSDRPPESKVMPLPSRAIGPSLAGAPWPR